MTREELDYILSDIEHKEKSLIEEFDNIKKELKQVADEGGNVTPLIQRLHDNLFNRGELLKQYRMAYKDFHNVN